MVFDVKRLAVGNFSKHIDKSRIGGCAHYCRGELCASVAFGIGFLNDGLQVVEPFDIEVVPHAVAGTCAYLEAAVGVIVGISRNAAEMFGIVASVHSQIAAVGCAERHFSTGEDKACSKLIFGW